MDPEAAGVTDDVFFSDPKCGAVQKPQNPQNHRWGNRMEQWKLQLASLHLFKSSDAKLRKICVEVTLSM